MRRNDRIGGVEGEESERGERWTRRGVLLCGRVGCLGCHPEVKGDPMEASQPQSRSRGAQGIAAP